MWLGVCACVISVALPTHGRPASCPFLPAPVQRAQSLVIISSSSVARSSVAHPHAHIRLHADYIADSVDAFLTDFGSEIPMDENEPLHLGFTFS